MTATTSPASATSPSDPWAGVAEMPPWWVQEHRMVTEVKGVTWLCTCGSHGRPGEPSSALFVDHLSRVKKAFYRSPIWKLRSHTPAPYHLRRMPDGSYRLR